MMTYFLPAPKAEVPDLMLCHLWAHRANEKRRARGQTVFVDTNAAAARAYPALRIYDNGLYNEYVNYEMDDPKSAVHKKTEADLVSEAQMDSARAKGLYQLQNRRHQHGHSRKAENLEPLIQQAESRLSDVWRKIKKFRELARKRGNPRHKIAARYLGLAIAPLIQDMIGHNEKLVFRTSTSGGKIPKGAKSPRRIAESNFTELAGDLLKLVDPRAQLYAGDLRYARRDLDWIKERFSTAKD